MNSWDLPNDCSRIERTIAEFLEDFARQQDQETEEFPGLKRLPKDADSWIGFLDVAKKLTKKFLTLEVQP